MNFVNRAVENFNLKNQNKELETKLFHSFELIGNSSNIIKIREQIEKLSNSDSRVLFRTNRIWKRISSKKNSQIIKKK